PCFFQAEDGIRYGHVTGVQTCAPSDLINQREEETRSTPEVPLVAPNITSRVQALARSADREGSFDARLVPLPITHRYGQHTPFEIGKRRVGKECRYRGSPYHLINKTDD